MKDASIKPAAEPVAEARPRRARKYGLIGLGAILLAAAAIVYSSTGSSPASDSTPAGQSAVATAADVSKGQFWTVRRGPLTISLLVPGTIQTKDTTNIVDQIEGNAKIIWVIDEGTMVKKGDKLIELEADGLDDRIYQQNAEALKGEAEYNSAEQALKMQELQNDSDLLSAENAVNMAELDMKKYNEGSYAQDTLQKQSAITIADSELKRAAQALSWTEKLVAKGYVSGGDLEADQLTVKKQQIQLELAKKDLTVYENFNHKSDLMKMENTLRENKANLAKVKLDNQFKLKSKQIDLDSAKASMEHEKTRLAELQDQKKATVMLAPRDGMVVYPDGSDRFNQFTVEVGADVHNRQQLLQLPDFSAWMVATKVHESVIQQVQPGMETKVTVDAFPNQQVSGKVAKISVMPDSTGRWMSPDVKQYIVNVDITAPDMKLKPGMTSKNEIILDNLKDALYVPIQAVSAQGDKPYVMLKGDVGARKREVEIGKANDSYVEIKTGLAEGDQVLLTAQGGNISGLIQRPAGKSDAKDDGKGGNKGGAKDVSEMPATPAAGQPAAPAAAPAAKAPQG